MSDPEETVTLGDILEAEADCEETTNAVLGGSDNINCSYSRSNLTLEDENVKLDDAPVVVQPPEAKVKRDWYQTESDVVLNILAKNIKKEDVTVAFETQEVRVDAKLPDNTDYNLKLALFKPVNASACSFKVLGTKIEIRMKKLDCSSWTSLEAVPVPTELRPTYPTSSKKKLDWDKLDKQIEKETKDDDQDVNSLFAKIYNSGDENTKKAMIKSMQESGGTVLSTNWDEVGKKPVEISPPDGMEYKKWDA